MPALALLLPLLPLPALLAAVGVILAPATIGAGIINLAGIFVAFMGMALDHTLTFFVVQFDSQIYSAIAGRLGEVWTAFRDIANIVIIGMFTFIAIATILGIESFGARKLIARVLIIAVLINFSLLFTRIIIASSNFVAGKFYSAMSLESLTNSAAAAGSEAPGVLDYASKAGISGRFVQLLGLNDALQAYGTVRSVYDAQDGWLSGSVWAIAYSFTTATIMVATGLVLFYAIFLLIARTILFIFLMVVSSLAFAAHLVPKWGDKFWDMWWSSLLRNAVFAPLLMLMLWATLIISYALVEGPGANRSFDKLFSNPTSGSGIMALLTFFLILGMLFGSIRFASAFSTKIVGFNWAAVVPAFGTALFARAAAFAGRQTIGRGSAWVGRQMQDVSKDTTKSLWTRQLYDFGAQQFKGLAKQDMNLMRTTFGKEVHGLVGNVPGLKKLDTLAGKAVKGFEGSQKARAGRYAEQAERMGLSKEETEQAFGAAIVDAMKRAPELGKQHAEASATVREGEKQIERLTAIQAETVSSFEKNMQQLTTNLENVTLRDTMHSTERTKKDIEDIKDQMNRTRTEHTAAMQREKQRIEEARLATQQARTSQQKAFTELHKVAEQAGTLPKTKEALASALANKRFTNVLKEAVGVSIDEKNDELAKLARKAVRESGEKKEAKKIADYLKKTTEEETPAPAQSPTPPKAPTHDGGTTIH
ncbi:MAG: hypothetical protein AAB605_02750 [Patescibacteria group bacterium]